LSQSSSLALVAKAITHPAARFSAIAEHLHFARFCSLETSAIDLKL